jgi:steroid delta-isomerase-like uncharacterized protein
MANANTTVGSVSRDGWSLDAFCDNYLEAWNTQDCDRILGLMTPDIVYDDPSWPVTLRGHEDVRDFMHHAFRAFPDMRFERVEGPYLLGQDKAAFWWRGTGTMMGPLDPPGFAPTGKSWQVDGADFHEYRDGRLSRLRMIFNMADASVQMGLMPKPGSRTESMLVALQRLGARLRRR